MSRLSKAACIGAGVALLAAAGHAPAQGAMSPKTGPRPATAEHLRQSAPRYDAGVEYVKAIRAMKAYRFKQAAQFAEHVTQAAPFDPGGWRLLGAAHAGDINWQGSRRAYAKAVKLEPDDANGHAGLGLALALLNDAKAQEQLDWLRARASVCGDTCADAAHLHTYIATVEGAIRASAAGPAEPG